jgi:hypothetical protein
MKFQFVVAIQAALAAPARCDMAASSLLLLLLLLLLLRYELSKKISLTEMMRFGKKNE